PSQAHAREPATLELAGRLSLPCPERRGQEGRHRLRWHGRSNGVLLRRHDHEALGVGGGVSVGNGELGRRLQQIPSFFSVRLHHVGWYDTRVGQGCYGEPGEGRNGGSKTTWHLDRYLD